jgi:hypothetical protein
MDEDFYGHREGIVIIDDRGNTIAESDEQTPDDHLGHAIAFKTEISAV